MRTELENLPQPNWFWHGEQILALLDQHRPKVCVELGTNRGCSAIAIARLIRQWGGHLTCVDIWEAEDIGASVTIAECRRNILAAGVSATIKLRQMRTDEAARRWSGEVDYLYVDADHTVEGCSRDLELWWPFLKQGGLIAGDDYDDVTGDPVRGVTAAWDAFEKTHGQSFERMPTSGDHGRLIWGVKR